MQLTRIGTYQAGEVGPTGPSDVLALAVPTGGTYLNLTLPEFAPLKSAIDKSVPLMMTVEVANVAYRFGIQGSGAQADPSSFVYGPTAANQSAMMFANTRLPLPEIAPQGANGLAVRAYGAVGTCVMRIWSTGG